MEPGSFPAVAWELLSHGTSAAAARELKAAAELMPTTSSGILEGSHSDPDHGEAERKPQSVDSEYLHNAQPASQGFPFIIPVLGCSTSAQRHREEPQSKACQQ
ncbi:unnamed protein product [Pleuronectes platessa]|uniref:Uncharacterized protein n=1 Tax=Pleuronectes platessa TaxID=8262 RepID=A0A9N7V7F2_PLEPL|nr:unnamed protein product [Pleuronectes platessa]